MASPDDHTPATEHPSRTGGAAESDETLQARLEALQRAHAELQNLFDSTDVATLFLDAALRVRRYTPRLTDLFDIGPADLGRPVEALRRTAEYDEIADDARQVIVTLRPVEREVEAPDERCFRARLVPYRTVDGRVDGVVVTFVDITRRQRAEETAARREARIRSAIENAPVPVLLHAEDGEILYLSRTVTEVTGYTPEELPTIAAWTERAYDERAPGIAAHIGRLYTVAERTEEREVPVRTKHGETRIWQFSSSPIGTDGRGRRLVMSVAADITERKRTEEEHEVRIRQQAAVAALGLYALSETTLQPLLDRAVEVVRDTLGVELVKVLELVPEDEALLLRAGAGWEAGLVGTAKISAAAGSQAGYTLARDTPVVIEDLATETRFSGPEWLFTHGVVSGMSVVIEGLERPFGVLGADTRSARTFGRPDVDFLQGIANIIASAADQAAVHRKLQDALRQLSATNEVLEARVEARTAALQDREARLRLLYDVVSQPHADVTTLIREALARATRLLGLDAGVLSRIEDDVYHVEVCHPAGSGLEPGQTFAARAMFCSVALDAGGPVAVDHMAASPYRTHPAYATFGFESYIGIPVRVAGRSYGTLCFAGRAPRTPPFSQDDADVLALLAQWISGALERTRTEQQMKHSERLLAGILLGALDGIAALEAVRDADGRIVDFVWILANPAASHAYGIPADALIGSTYLEILPGAREAGLFDAFVRVVETGEPFQHELYYEADGLDGWFAVSAVRLGDGLAVTFRDVTERRQTEEALRESEARFRELFESSPDAIFVENLDGVVLDVNPAACRLHHADREWLIGRSLLDLVPPGYREQAMHDFARLAAGQSSLLESYSFTRDGTAVPVEVRTDRLTYAGQQAVLLHVRDVTTRRAAERALVESEERFAKAFHAAPVAVTIATFDEGRYIDVNESFCALTGYGRYELAGRTNAELGLTPHLTERLPGLAQLDALGRVREVEFQIQTRSGTLRDAVVSSELLEIGGSLCVLSIGFDVTEHKRLEREVIETAEMERRRIGQDLHDELGQQLAGAAFLGQALQQKLALQGRAEAEEAGRLTALITDALAETRDLSRLLSPVDIQAEGLMDALQDLADQTERIFEIPCCFETEGDVRVRDNAAATHLYRIGQEAVNNAVKHARPTSITLRLIRGPDGLHLLVLDDGTGFDPALLPRPHGIGIRTMHYRAALIGAALTIERGTRGSRVAVHLPL